MLGIMSEDTTVDDVRRALDAADGTPPEEALPHLREAADRLTELIKAHRTTIVFVNTRRLAERVARHDHGEPGRAPATKRAWTDAAGSTSP
jgi:hypothetical protein